jgi:hypothetical protein
MSHLAYRYALVVGSTVIIWYLVRTVFDGAFNFVCL